MKDRATRISDIRKGQKPSFAARHPIATGLAAYGAYKYLTSPRDDEQQARVVYPQN